MASGDIRIHVECRPCLVNGEKALFHTWTHESCIHNAFLKGDIGDISGVISTTKAIVELEDGSVKLMDPSDIKFCDERIKDYCFFSLLSKEQGV